MAITTRTVGGWYYPTRRRGCVRAHIDRNRISKRSMAINDPPGIGSRSGGPTTHCHEIYPIRRSWSGSIGPLVHLPHVTLHESAFFGCCWYCCCCCCTKRVHGPPGVRSAGGGENELRVFRVLMVCRRRAVTSTLVRQGRHTALGRKGTQTPKPHHQQDP